MPNSCALGKNLMCIVLLIPALLFTSDLWAGLAPPKGSEVAEIMARVAAAYAKCESYQTAMEVREYRKGKFVEAKRFLYTFKKPNQLRIDMESPRPGTVLVFPDKNGKVIIQAGGWTGFVTLHLAPDNALLASGTGQRIDQSDFGLLIRNIGHSLTDRRRREIGLSDVDGQIIIEVLADDHFLPNVQTLYRLVIDKTRWLPLEVHESAANGSLRRKTIFRDLKTSIAVTDSFFRIPGSR